MLNIGFDAKRAFLNGTGLGNYSRSVLSFLPRLFPDNNYFLYTPKLGPDIYREILAAQNNIRIVTPSLPLFRSAWRSRFIVPRLLQDKLELFHGLSHEIPIGIHATGIKTVVTIHDLIFLRYPQYYKRIDRNIYEAKIKYACRNADKIVAISEQTKKDILTFTGVPEGKIEVIYQSCDGVFAEPVPADKVSEVRAKYLLPDRYLLYVGTVEKRKNLMVLAKALRSAPKDVQLVVVGKLTEYASAIKAFLENAQLTSRVKFLEQVPFSDLPVIYKLAEIFLYPSEFEGFGIPVLEALNAGIPVIAATGSCLEEAGGPDSIYLPPHDDSAWTDAITGLWNSPAERKKMAERGKHYAAGFSEDKQATQLFALYQRLIG